MALYLLIYVAQLIVYGNEKQLLTVLLHSTESWRYKIEFLIVLKLWYDVHGTSITRGCRQIYLPTSVFCAAINKVCISLQFIDINLSRCQSFRQNIDVSEAECWFIVGHINRKLLPSKYKKYITERQICTTGRLSLAKYGNSFLSMQIGMGFKSQTISAIILNYQKSPGYTARFENGFM